MVEISDGPLIWAMSVPMANAMGKPRMFNPGVTIQPPPMPKKPPMMPTPNPRMSKPGQKIGTPAIGMTRCIQSISASVQQPSTSVLRQCPVFQIDPKAGHHQIRQEPEGDATQRNDQDRHDGKQQVALVVQIPPPGFQAVQFAGVGHNHNRVRRLGGEEPSGQKQYRQPTRQSQCYLAHGKLLFSFLTRPETRRTASLWERRRPFLFVQSEGGRIYTRTGGINSSRLREITPAMTEATCLTSLIWLRVETLPLMETAPSWALTSSSRSAVEGAMAKSARTRLPRARSSILCWHSGVNSNDLSMTMEEMMWQASSRLMYSRLSTMS